MNIKGHIKVIYPKYYKAVIYLHEKLEIKETKTTQYSTFKTDIIKVGLVFLICNFFINNIYPANKLSAKKYLLARIWL